MRRRDRLKGVLKGLFHRRPSRQEPSRSHTTNEAASRQGPTEAIGDQHSISHASTPEATPAPRTSRSSQRADTTSVPPTIVSTSPDVSTEPPFNEAFARALQEHSDGLEGEEKNAFRDASNGITDKNVLRDLQDLSDDHKQNSLLRRHSESLTKFLGLIDRLLGNVALGVQMAPEPSSLVVGGLRLLISLAKEFASFFSRLSKMMIKFDDFLDVLAEYAKSASDNSLICKTLAAVYGDILKFYQKARRVFVTLNQEKKKHVSITSFFRLQWEPFEESFCDIESSMQDHLQVLGHAAAATMVGQLSLREDKIKKRELVKDRKDFLKWISTASHEERHRAVHEKKHPGTDDWFLQTHEFRQWLNSAEAALLWCHGKPGSGKSVLASHVIETILEQYEPDKEVGICFAYYDYRQSDSQRFAQIVLALIKQLCRKAAIIPIAFKKAMEDDDSPSTLANLNHFTTITSKFKKVFLIIDALDECLEDDGRRQMLRLLAQALGDISHIRIFVTSRRESDIVHKFEALGMPTIQLKAESVSADIKNYVTNEVSRLRSEKELYISDKLAEEVINTLPDRAEGMFLWVDLQLKQLCKESQTHKDQDVEQALKRLPWGLDETYGQVAKRIECGANSMKNLAIACFMWVFHAERPLTMDELRYAVAITGRHTDLEKSWLEPAEKEPILFACASMLEVDSNDIVRPIHYSVQEFFTKPVNPDQGDFAQLGQGCYSHQILATTCIDELSYRLQSGPRQDRMTVVSPFVQYAARHFNIHASKTDGPSEDFLQKLKIFVSLGESYHRALDQLRAVGPHLGSQYRPDLSLVSELGDFWKEWEITRGMMHEAASVVFLGLVQHCLDQESNVDEKDELGEAALYYASSRGHIEVVQMLPDKRSNINVQGGLYGNAPQAASSGGHEEVVQMLRGISSSMKIASSRPIPLPPVPNKYDSAEIWKYLQPGIDCIMALEGIDTKTYICLYTEIHKCCTAQNPVGSAGFGGGGNSRKDVYARSEDLYNRLVKYLKKHLRNVYMKSTEHAGEALLTFYIKELNRYTVAAKYNRKLFQFLDRNWVRNAIDEGRKNIYDIYTLHSVLWDEIMFMQTKENVIKSALHLVEKQRNGETIEQDRIKIVDYFLFPGLDEFEREKATPDVYKKFFEEFFLEATDRYCRKESSGPFADNSVSEYTGFLTIRHTPYGLVWLWRMVSRHAITGTDSTREVVSKGMV